MGFSFRHNSLIVLKLKHKIPRLLYTNASKSMQSTPKKILVIRNDKLGDFMLSLPSFHLLKSSLPDTEIHALVPEYTRDMASVSTDIDKIINDPGSGTNYARQFNLWREIRGQHYDAVITLYSTTRIGLLLWLARIPYRLAPATKIAQVFYNNRLAQRRSKSEKPEYEYNIQLIQYYLNQLNIKTIETANAPFLQFPGKEVQQTRLSFCNQYKIDHTHKLIFIHPGSGGSAVNLSTHQFAELAKELHTQNGHTIVISAGPGEQDNAEQLAKLLPIHTPHVVYVSTQGLLTFARHIAFADLFISGSTGPLHIAGALNRPTVGFYPRRRSATALRWQTLSTDDRRLSFSPGTHADAEDMSGIDISAVADKINKRLLIS